MKLTKEMIEGLIEEELAETKLRKYVQNEIRSIAEDQRQEQQALMFVQSLDNAISNIKSGLDPDSGYIRKKLSEVEAIVDEVHDKILKK